MNVEVTFPELPRRDAAAAHEPLVAGPLRDRTSSRRTCSTWRSPTAPGSALAFTRPNPHQWDVQQPGGTVRVAYRVFGDRVDGTYLAIDATHAHINMPAALMWARGLGERAAQVRFEPPPGTSWRVATQLFPGADRVHLHRAEPAVPDGQPVGVRRLRPAHLHGARRRAQAGVPRGGAPPGRRRASSTASSRDVEKIVREARNVFGEFAPFDGNTYTFLADYLPWADGDGMEHRNSTVITSGVVDPRQPRSTCWTRWRTSSSTPGTWSGSGRRRSSRSTSRTPTSRASCGSPRASPATTRRSSRRAPA